MVSRVREHARTLDGPISRQITAQCEAVDAAITPIRRASLWLDIGPLSYLPLGSPVLSMSFELRPDIVLRVPGGPAAGLHVLDAKFRIARTGADESEAKVDDLHKMHTYRDAINAVRSAWVLYPGEETSAFGDDGRVWDLGSLEPPPHSGIGAIGISPSSGPDALRAVLKRILTAP